VQRFLRARGDPSLAVLEGFHPLKHALRFGAEIETACTCDRGVLADLAARLAPDLSERLREVAPVPASVFEHLAPMMPAGGVIAIARRPTQAPERVLDDPSPAPIVLLENPSQLGNLGAVVRVAAAAGAAAVLTTGPRDPWHPAALRGSAGLHFALPVGRIDAIPTGRRPLVAIDPEGEPVDPALIPDGAILAFGSERRGLSAAMLARAGRRLAIPMRPGVSSLNLATAVAVVLYLARLGR
jgi:TrmH family RNA methyltransferase